MAQDVGMQQLIQRFVTRLDFLEHDRLVSLSERVSMIESIHAVHEKYVDDTKKRMEMIDAKLSRDIQLRRMQAGQESPEPAVTASLAEPSAPPTTESLTEAEASVRAAILGNGSTSSSSGEQSRDIPECFCWNAHTVHIPDLQ